MWQPEGRINNMILKGNKRTSLCGPIFNFKMIKEYQFWKTEKQQKKCKKIQKRNKNEYCGWTGMMLYSMTNYETAIIWAEFPRHASCNSEDNIKSPVHWVVQFLVHDHGLKHGSLAHDKFNHTVYEAQEVPVGITVVTTTTNNMWKLVTITVKSNMVRWTSSPQSWLKKVSFFFSLELNASYM